MRRGMQLESTALIGITTRGTGTRLIRPELSISDVAPGLQATEKKLNVTRPQSRNTGNFGLGETKTFVKTKVNTVIMISGFTTDQDTPKDIFRYRIRQSFA